MLALLGGSVRRAASGRAQAWRRGGGVALSHLAGAADRARLGLRAPRRATVPPDDPIRSSPYDIVEQARLRPSPDAVQPTLARHSRFCTYDLPDTGPDGTHRSTSTPQPHTVHADADADVDDIVALIGAARLPRPFVVVAHSYGGLVADLLARAHPELVSRLVMVDPVSEFLPGLGARVPRVGRDGATRGTAPVLRRPRSRRCRQFAAKGAHGTAGSGESVV